MKTLFRRLIWILIAEGAAVALLDQLVKGWVRREIDPELPVEVISGFFHLVHWTNTGIAFGLLREHPEILTGLGLAALVAIPVLFWLECRRDPRLAVTVWGLGMILGGALGNVIDRLRIGHVTDFLLFSIGSYRWPAFNLADSAITVGTVLVLWTAWRQAPGEDPAPSAPEPSPEATRAGKAS